jgi:L-asparaginase/Glu-tRNA(Gln) amidotransferase subunit D
MKNLFERRLEMRIDAENPVALQGLLDMYANPVVNQLKHSNELKAKILLLYTGGTIGMSKDFETGALKASISISYCKKF